MNKRNSFARVVFVKIITMVAYFCHHSSDNYADLPDLYVVFSDLNVDLSDLYVDLSDIMSTCQILN